MDAGILMELRMFTRFFAENIPNESESYNAEKKSYIGFEQDIINIHSFSIYSSVLTAIYQDMIAASKFTVNTAGWVEANAPINQTTTRLEHTAEKTFNWGFVTVYTYKNLSSGRKIVNDRILQI